jgi:hypothetical protein
VSLLLPEPTAFELAARCWAADHARTTTVRLTFALPAPQPRAEAGLLGVDTAAAPSLQVCTALT